MKYVFCIFYFICVVVADDSFDDKQVYFLQTIEVQDCDRFGWCKIKNKNQYIKKQYYNIDKNGFVSLKTGQNIKTWTYVKSSYIDNKDRLKQCIDKYATDNEKRNIKVGYIKIQLIKRCSNKIKQNENISKQQYEIQQIINSTKKYTNNHKEQKISNKQNIFVDMAFGYGKIEIQNSVDESKLTNNTLDENGINFKIGIGYRWTQELYSQLELDKMDIDNSDIDSIYASLNYRFFKTNFKLYLGIMLGASQLKWQSSPVKNYHGNKIDSSLQSLYGVKFGLSKTIYKDTEVFVSYRLFKVDFKTIVEGDEIYHKLINSLIVGVRYDF